MKKKLIDSPFSINPLITDPEKTFAGDYTRKFENFAINLTDFIENRAKEKPLVISLSAKWGLGKSTFVDMWGNG